LSFPRPGFTAGSMVTGIARVTGVTTVITGTELGLRPRTDLKRRLLSL
jgi:hypothetical protein